MNLPKLLFTVVKAVLVVLAGLLSIGILLDFTHRSWVLWLSGGLGALVAARFLFPGRRPLPPPNPPAPRDPGQPSARPAQPYRLVFTHDENVLDRLESRIAQHPKVQGVFQDSGQWYSNGEAGPEWFAMHVTCAFDDREELKAFINQQLAAMGHGPTSFRS